MVIHERQEAAKQFFSIKEFAAILGLNESTVYEAIKRGDVRAVRIGPKLWRIPTSEIDRLLREAGIEG